MDRERINRNAEVLRNAKSFESFVEMLCLPEDYKTCHWLERDYRTLRKHNEVFAKSLMLPEADSIGKLFTSINGDYDMAQPSGSYFICGNGVPDRPDRVFNEKGKYYKAFASPNFSTRKLIGELFGDVSHTRSFEMIKWDDGRTLVLVHHGSVVPATGWLAVLPPS